MNDFKGNEWFSFFKNPALTALTLILFNVFLINLFITQQTEDADNRVLEKKVKTKNIKNDRQSYFKKQDWIHYYEVILKRNFSNITVTEYIAASLINVVWLFFLVKLHLFRKVNWVLTWVVLLCGMFFSFGVEPLHDYNTLVLGNALNGGMMNDFLYSIFGIGLIEELTKIAPLLLLMLFSTTLKDPYDYLFYASISALGFAFVENLLYFSNSSSHGIIFGRAVSSVVGHMFNGALVAYGFVLAKFRYKSLFTIFYFLLFLLLSSLEHGIYDFLLFHHYLFIFVVFFLFSCIVWIVLINNSLNNSLYFNHLFTFDHRKIQYYMVVSLTLILCFEYSFAGIKEGAASANHYLLRQSTMGVGMITFLSTHFSKIDLVPQYWRSISLTSVDLNSTDTFINIIRFFTAPFAGNTAIPINISGRNVFIKSSAFNPVLKVVLPQWHPGVIAKRVMITENDTQGKNVVNPHWFQISFSTPLIFNSNQANKAFFKFQKKEIQLDKEEEWMVHFFLLPEEFTKEEINKSDLISMGLAIMKI